MKRIIALTVAAIALLAWAGARSDDAEQPSLRRVRWSDGAIEGDPTLGYVSLANATVLMEVGEFSVVVGDSVESGGERRIHVAQGDESLLGTNVSNDNVGSSIWRDEVRISTIDDGAVALRVFRDSGIVMEDVLEDPETGVTFAVVIGEDVHGYHVLDADGRVLLTSA